MWIHIWFKADIFFTFVVFFLQCCCRSADALFCSGLCYVDFVYNSIVYWVVVLQELRKRRKKSKVASCRPPKSWYVLCLQEVGNWGFEEHCYVHGLGIAAQCETIEAPLVGRIVVLLTSLCFTRPHKSHSSVSFCQKAMEKVQMSHYYFCTPRAKFWKKCNFVY